jgi:outer membrane protein assembly factor BamE
MRKVLISILASASLLFGGCGLIYKIDVQQGNVVTQDMLNKVKPGMTKNQVRFALGTPLIQDAFHRDRWDYVYEMQKDGKVVKRSHLTLFFKDDKLVRMQGDMRPKGESPDADGK